MGFDDENIRKFFPIFIGLLVAAFIIIIIIVWVPKDKKIEFLNFGEYTENDAYEKYEKIYSDDIAQMITAQQYNKLYSLLSDDYIKANSLTEDNFYQFLLTKGLVSSTIKTGDYTAYKSGENVVYIIDFIISGKTIKVNLTESKPYDYKLSFGDITYEEKIEETKKRITKGLEFEISRTEKSSEKIQYNIKITNTNENSVELDLLNYNNLLLTKEDGKVTTGVIENNDIFTLNNNSSITTNVTFNIPASEQAKITGLKFKKVKIDGKTESLEISI